MSTCIASLDYDAEEQTLTITFQQRGTFKYYDVSLEEYTRLEFSGSQGYIFNQAFRDIKSFERIA